LINPSKPSRPSTKQNIPHGAASNAANSARKLIAFFSFQGIMINSHSEKKLR
jgi:hypothetical protein